MWDLRSPKCCWRWGFWSPGMLRCVVDDFNIYRSFEGKVRFVGRKRNLSRPTSPWRGRRNVSSERRGVKLFTTQSNIPEYQPASSTLTAAYQDRPDLPVQVCIMHCGNSKIPVGHTDVYDSICFHLTCFLYPSIPSCEWWNNSTDQGTVLLTLTTT